MTSSLWWETVSAAERSVLERRDEGLHPNPDVLVVGGGVVGVATAYACHQAGVGRVVLVESNSLGSGATGGGAGLLVPEAHHGSDPAHFVDFCRRSLALWWQIEEAVPGGVSLVDMDWIGLEPHPRVWDPPPTAQHLDAGEVARLIPGLARPVPGVLVPHQARLAPLRSLARLATTLDAVATGVAVTGVSTRGARLLEVSTTAGPIRAGTFVFATGGPPRLAGLDLGVPSVRVRGHLLATAPVPIRWPGSVAPLATQIDDGRLLVGGTEDVDNADEVDQGLVAAIRQYLDTALPHIAKVATTHAWCCFRPAHPDHLPVVDRIPGLENAWFTSGHYKTGILMAPATGAALAEWIGTGRPPSVVAALSGARFSPSG